MIILTSPDGHRQRLRWTDRHPLSSYGLGVVLRARSSIPLDGEDFAALARQGWRIECSSHQERRRVTGALAWASLGLPDEALVVREDMEKDPYPS
jgi:hypothetical protein